MKFHVVTFGCQMNALDSDWLSRSLRARGWEEVAEEEAKVFLVNTCSVREKPVQKVYSQLGRLGEHYRRDPDVFVAVGGCVAQQLGAALFERFPFVRLVFGGDGVAMAPGALERLVKTPGLKLSLVEFQEFYPERPQEFPDERLPVQAFVNIMQGCDNFCAYCIVPFVRGRQKSRASASILDECRALLDRGVKEITLLGQNVNSYGLDKSGDGVGFAELLRRVASLPGLARLKFTTSHPKDLAPEVVAAFGELSCLSSFLHLPVQSGSDRILDAMGRRYTRADYLRKVAALRLARPDIALSTDLIVGFPGETEDDFQETLSLVSEVGYDSSFSFKYCDRPGARAVKLEPKVDEPVKADRLRRLQELQTDLTTESLARRVGRTAEVLVEGHSVRAGREREWRGRDEGGRIVNFQHDGSGDLEGKLVRVEILVAKKHSLWGKAVSEPW